MLNSLKPSVGVGIDFDKDTIKEAKKKYPNLTFLIYCKEEINTEECFDYVILSDIVGRASDIWKLFRLTKKLTNGQSRILINYYNFLWEPVLLILERAGLKKKQPKQSWFSVYDIENMLTLSGFKVIKRDKMCIFPAYIPVISFLLNNFVAKFPLIDMTCLIYTVIARKIDHLEYKGRESVSVIVPTRNEKGNIKELLERMPKLGEKTEIIFVDGASTDGTIEEIEDNIKKYGEYKEIKLIHQVEKANQEQKTSKKMLKKGKGDAVRKGFDAAKGDILIILDADLSVPPEDLIKFYLAIKEGKGDFINGSRLIYPMEKEAMRLLNIFANKIFGYLFTWLLGQRIKDTLCGTKALLKDDYIKIKEGRDYFGKIDPFGDFDLLFGAAKNSLEIVEIPVRYQRRTYGVAKIERFRHGWLLLKMYFVGLKKFKFR